MRYVATMTLHQPIDVEQVTGITVDEYLQLSETGALAGLGHTELIEGVIATVAAEYRPHMRVRQAVFLALHAAVKQGALPYEVFLEATVAILERSAPQPDIFLTDDYQGDGFVPGRSVPLVVEVSASTPADDLKVKSELYARGGIPECWVVDVENRVVHQMWEPSPTGYRRRIEIAFGNEVRSIALPEICFILPDHA